MQRPTFEAFKKKALKKPVVKEAFDKLKLKYKKKLNLIKMRKEENANEITKETFQNTLKK